MNYKTNYNRSTFAVNYPQLEKVRKIQNLSEQKSGRKRFGFTKNQETSATNYGYNISNPKPIFDYKNHHHLFASSDNIKQKAYSVIRNLPSYEKLHNRNNSQNDIFHETEKNLDKNQFSDEKILENSEKNVLKAQKIEENNSKDDFQSNTSENLLKLNNPHESPKNKDIFSEEIKKLEEELKEKEKELSQYKDFLIPKPKYTEETLNKISKLQYDKDQIIKQKLYNSQGLDIQINEKNKKKQAEIEKKNKEKEIRLEEL